MKYMWIITLFVSAILIYSYFIEPNRIKVSNLSIELPELPGEFEGFKILQLTDLHGRRFIQGDDYLIKLANDQKADMIVITGDMIMYPEDMEYVLGLICQMKATGGIYFSPGNHEYKLSFELLKFQLEAKGITVLKNKTVEITDNRGNIGFTLVGLDDYGDGEPELLEKLIEPDPHKPVILLSHSPDIAGEAIDNRVNLVLSGHTHGGQICFPFFGAVFTACKNYWKEYESGYYRERDTQIYVNRGLGCSLLPLRFLCPPEIAVFTLQKGT